MARDSGWLMHLRITEVSGKLSGYIQLLSEDVDAADGFTSKQLHITGEVSGSAFSLHGEGIPECEGTRKGRRLLLHFPMENGLTVTLTLEPTSVSEWNSTVSGFQQKHRLAAFRTRWSTALWTRFNTISREYQDANQKLESINKQLPGKQAELDRVTKQEKTASDGKAKIKDVLTAAKDKLKVEIELAKNRDSDVTALETAQNVFAAACAAAVTDCDESAAKCDLQNIRDEFLKAKEEFKSAGDEASEATKEMRLTIGQENLDKAAHRGDIEHHLNCAQNRLSSADIALDNIDYDLHNVYTGVWIDIRRAQDEVDKDKADIKELNRQVTADRKELSYLAGQGITKLMQSFAKGILIGTVISDTTIYQHPDTQSSQYSLVSKGVALAVLNAGWDWSPVFMEDKEIGWVESKSIKFSFCQDNGKQPSRKKHKY